MQNLFTQSKMYSDWRDSVKHIKRASAIVLTICLIAGNLFALNSFAAGSEFDSNFQENDNWINSNVSQVNTKYNNGDKFIVFYYRPDTCYNSYFVGNYSLVPWMDCGTKVYGLNCDSDDYYYLPSWLYEYISGSVVLPCVLFIDNKTVEIYKGTDYSSSMTEMVKALNQKYTSFTGNVIDSSALDSSKLTFSVTYHQTEARSILNRINSLRTGSDAWYWSADNTEKIICSGLGELTYDYDLEKAAMQRAAELAVYYAHTRPNGESSFTAYSSSYAGENIAYGQTSASQVQTAWEEATEMYEGQGHRRNMLSSGYSAVGIGCAEYNGRKFWVQEFRRPTISTAVTMVNDSAKTVSVTVLDKLISSKTLTPSYSSLSLKKGEVSALPTVSQQVSISAAPHNTFSSLQNCTWSSNNTSVATVSSGNVKAVGAGNAVLTGECNAGKVSIAVTVSSGATPTTYTLTYNANGGSGAPSSQTGNGIITLSSVKPSRSGYTFLGWSTNSGASSAQYQPGASYALTSNKTLYAIWSQNPITPISYTLTYNANGGSGAPSSQTGNGSITLSTVKPVRDGYTFLGWSTYSNATSAQYSAGSNFNLTSNKTLYAVWRFGSLGYDESVENPTSGAKLNVRSSYTVSYRSKVTITATAENVPEGYSLIICDGNARLAKGDNKSVSYNAGELRESRTFTIKIVDSNGNIQKDGNGMELSKTCTVTVKNNFFNRIAAFFKALFRKLPIVEIKP